MIPKDIYIPTLHDRRPMNVSGVLRVSSDSQKSLVHTLKDEKARKLGELISHYTPHDIGRASPISVTDYVEPDPGEVYRQLTHSGLLTPALATALHKAMASRAEAIARHENVDHTKYWGMDGVVFLWNPQYKRWEIQAKQERKGRPLQQYEIAQQFFSLQKYFGSPNWAICFDLAVACVNGQIGETGQLCTIRGRKAIPQHVLQACFQHAVEDGGLYTVPGSLRYMEMLNVISLSYIKDISIVPTAQMLRLSRRGGTFDDTSFRKTPSYGLLREITDAVIATLPTEALRLEHEEGDSQI